MKRLLVASALVICSIANAGGVMHNGAWYGIGVPTAANIFYSVGVPAPAYQTQYIYTNPVAQPAPVVMQEEIVHSAVMNGPFKGNPKDVFISECMRYGYNQNQCIAIWGN
jgi:hypothetical protein